MSEVDGKSQNVDLSYSRTYLQIITKQLQTRSCYLISYPNKCFESCLCKFRQIKKKKPKSNLICVNITIPYYNRKSERNKYQKLQGFCCRKKSLDVKEHKSQINSQKSNISEILAWKEHIIIFQFKSYLVLPINFIHLEGFSLR